MRTDPLRVGATRLHLQNPYELAGEYHTVRPRYPDAAVAALLADTENIADIGAGTGILTRQLLAAAAENAKPLRIKAIEPSAQMRAQLAKNLHDSAANTRTSGTRRRETPAHSVEILSGTGEATGLPENSVDLVVYGQSWHWVAAQAAAVEAARLLETTHKNARLAIIYNQLNVAVPWVKRLTRIMRSGDVQRPERPPTLTDIFNTPQLQVFDWARHPTPEQLMALGRSHSSYLQSSMAGREHMQRNLSWYLYEHLGFKTGQTLEVPYRTLLWTATPR